MSRFLAAFRAGRAAQARGAFLPPYGSDNHENPENPSAPQEGESPWGGFRGSRGIRDSEGAKNAVAPEVERRAALLVRAAAEAAAALADGPGAGELDAAERAALAAHYAEPPRERPYMPGDPDPLRDGLMAGELMRPPAWEGAAPPRGAYCSCCGRHAPQAGGRWWEPRHPRSDGAGTGPGWRCATCHPAPPRAITTEVLT
jgi:hypothetical protein